MDKTCLEALFIRCELPSAITFVVGQIYQPPSFEHSTFMNEFTRCLEKLDQLNKTTFLCGDFNIDLFALLKNNNCQYFFNTLASFGYWPTISKTTRFSDQSSSLIDNIFCNNIEFVTKSGIIYTDTSDHFPIFVSCASQMSPNKPTWHTIFDKNKYDELSLYLTEQLKNFSEFTDPEAACNAIIETYQKGIHKYSRKIKHNRKSAGLKPWISPAILASINRRHSLFVEKNKNPSQQNCSSYTAYRNELNSLLRVAKRKYIQHQLETNRTNSKKLWQLLNDVIKGNSSSHQQQQSFMKANGEYTCKKEEIAESFNEFFISIGENLQEVIPSSDMDPLQYVNMQSDHIFNSMDNTDAAELQDIVKNMKNVGAGIDDINASIFKHTFPNIVNELVHLINLCLNKGFFPSALKIAVVKPIFKTGDKKQFNNYRPISILPYISKILEKVIHIRTMSYLQDANVLSASQYGFQKNKSTYMPLLLLQENITKAFENGKLVCGIYLDLKKAFDTVDHMILIRKLVKYGFAGSTLKIFESYLVNRYQCVDYSGVRSSLKPVQIGVPQGSILGPLLFLLYINDFPNISNNIKFLLYADDTAIFFESDNVEALQLQIEQESIQICNWLQMNKLTLNTKKTVYQLYKNSNTLSNLNITLNNVNIREVTSVLYLGVHIDSGLKWSAHIDHLTFIISRNIGVINRVKYFLNKQSLILLYNSLVLPYINYCCLVWGFTFQTYIRKIEILQKRIIRIIDDKHRLAHADPIFRSLNMLKVMDIAKQQLISVMHRKIIGTLPSELNYLFSLANTQSITRHKSHFNETFSRKLYRTRVASWTGPRLWNSCIAPHFSIADLKITSKECIKRHAKKQFILAYV